jgi:hypothetical protein
VIGLLLFLGTLGVGAQFHLIPSIVATVNALTMWFGAIGWKLTSALASFGAMLGVTLGNSTNAWQTFQGKPFVTVSPNAGVAGGPPNNGADYGPDTFGSTTLGIQEALNSGQPVKLLPGTFSGMTTTISLPSNSWLVGSGWNTIIQSVASGSPIYTVEAMGVSNVHVQDICFDAHSSTSASPLLLNSTSAVTSQIYIQRCKFINYPKYWYINFNANGLSSSSFPNYYTQDVTIENCWFDVVSVGGSGYNEMLNFCSSQRSVFRNNTIYINTASNLPSTIVLVYASAQETTLEGNIFSYHTTGGGNSIALNNCIDCTIRDNTFWVDSTLNSSGPIIIQMSTGAQRIHVIGNRTNCFPGTNFTTNKSPISNFIEIVYQAGPCAYGSPTNGPDGNYSQTSGYVDFVTIEDNYIIGVGSFINFLPSGNTYYVFTQLTIRGNVVAAIRGFVIMGTPVSGACGSAFVEGNTDISDLLAGASNCGSATTGSLDWCTFQGQSGAIIASVTIKGNRFASTTRANSHGAVGVFYVGQASVEGNYLGAGSGAGSTSVYFNYGNCTTMSAQDNGNYNPQGFAVTTPGVPTTGNGYTNAFPFSVRIYFLTASSATFTITDPSSHTSSAIPAVAGMSVTLDVGAKITPTYSSLTWEFYGT